MPDKKSPGDSTTDEEKSSGGSKSLFTTIGISVLLVGVGFFLGGKMSAAPAPAPEGEVEEEVIPESEEIGALVDLDPVNVNLADGRYLRVAVSLGLEHAPGGGGHGGGDEEFNGAPASDILLKTFTGKSIDELSTAEGREHARHELEEGLVPFYGEEIVSLYFTEFVMQ